MIVSRFCSASAMSLLLAFALFSVSCSKQSSSNDAAAGNHSAKPDIIDLGVVQLSDKVPMHIELASGQTCAITPTLQADGTLKIAMIITKQETNGKTSTNSAPTVSTLPDRAVQISVGDIGVKFTPRLNSK